MQRPDISHLKHELENIDISTNIFVQTTSEIVPLDHKIYHPTLGLVTSPHPDIKNAIELVDFQRGTSAHRHINGWKRRLKGTIVTAVDGKPITTHDDITAAISTARQERKKEITIEFGSLAGFAMSGEGIPTLQADQLNVIAHHIYSIRSQHDLWPDKTQWPETLATEDIIKQEILVSKLQRRKLKLQSDWNSFLKSEWKQLNRYHQVGMFGYLNDKQHVHSNKLECPCPFDQS